LGAREIAPTLSQGDVVLVVDVTGTPTERDFVIEKCAHPALQEFFQEALRGLSYDLVAGCPDPISQSDEVDVYGKVCPLSCFMGVPVIGGDYNAGKVRLKEQSLEAISEALCRISERFSEIKEW